MEQTEATLGVEFSIATGETVGCNSLHYVGYASNEGQEIHFGAWGAKNPAFTTDIGEKYENGEAIIVVTDEMVLYSEGSCARRTIEQFDDPIRDYPTLWETREEELSETYEMEGWTINVLRYRYERVPDNERNLVDPYSVAVEYVNNGGTQRPVWKSACGTKLGLATSPRQLRLGLRTESVITDHRHCPNSPDIHPPPARNQTHIESRGIRGSPERRSWDAHVVQAVSCDKPHTPGHTGPVAPSGPQRVVKLRQRQRVLRDSRVRPCRRHRGGSIRPTEPNYISATL